MAYLQMYQVEAGQLLQTLSAHQLPLSSVVVPQAYQFALSHGFPVTARWLELELHGYRGPGGGPASIDALLGLPPQHPVVQRVLSYRVLEGQFLVQFGGSPPVPLPVQKLMVHGVAEVEQIASGAASAFEGRVPLMHLPPHPISVQIAAQAQALGQEFIQATFAREQFVRLLGGLRREILRMLSTCIAGEAAA